MDSKEMGASEASIAHAKAIVKDIVKDLENRQGLGDEWDTLKNDGTHEEIIARWEGIIIAELEGWDID